MTDKEETGQNGVPADNVYQAALLQAEGKTEEAEAALREILDGHPDQPDALHLLAILEFRKERSRVAADLVSRAIAINADNPDYHATLGSILKAQSQITEAGNHFARAAALSPENADYHFHCAEMRRLDSKNAQAEESYRKALSLRPDFPLAGNGLGIVLDEQGKNEEAEACFREALKTMGENPDLLYNLGNVLKDQHRPDEALTAYRRALEIRPDFPEAHVQIAFALLLKGDFTAAWEEYEWRWRMPTFTSNVRNFDQPVWDGAALDGRTILLHAEQGFGDTLQFARYAKAAADRGGRVIFECPPPLARLMKTAAGVDEVIASGQPLPPFDCHAALLSLPGIVGTTLETVPADVPYLSAEPDLVSAWAERLKDAPGLKIGIAWCGTAEKRGNPSRACPLSAFEPLSRQPDISLFSLQKDPPEEDLPLPDGLTDLSGDLNDFADTAAVIQALDLIVSIDTAVAHLAGALACPAWVMLSTAGDWRWLMERGDSPWYPTLRLFRQTRARQWDDILEAVSAEAAALIASQG
ncbi:MAG: tetratricopeptide repeat protein [Proteobacteria bacterium]|nr:tetratricopeptide repeat protein [Pseudomonadota bacterium]